MSGVESLKEYFHSPDKARIFCQVCASPIYSYRVDLPAVIRLRLGTITHSQVPAPTAQSYVQHKASFLHIAD